MLLIESKDEYGEYIIATIDGYEVMVDKCDELTLRQYIWHIREDYRHGYKTIFRRYRIGGGKRKTVIISRDILCVTDINIFVDHRDGNTLNNRRHNLRESTNSQNQYNRKMLDSNKSGIKGVHWYKNYGKWVAVITVMGKKKTLGYFDNIEDAARARKEAEQLYCDGFAR